MQPSIQDSDHETEKEGSGEGRNINNLVQTEQNFWQKMLFTVLVSLPVLSLGALGCSNFNQLTDQLVYIKFGGKLGNTSELNVTCTTSLNKTGEDHAQASASEFRLYSRLGRCAGGLIFLPFWGAHTDKYGRHTAVIAGSVSALMYTVPLLLVVLSDAVPLWILLIGDTLHGIFGCSSHLWIIACASFTADVFHQGNRILMMICIDTVFLAAYTIGQIGGGYWIQASGFIPVVIAMVGLQLLVLFYGILFFQKLARQYNCGTKNMQGNRSAGFQYFIMTYKCLTKNRLGYARAYLLLTIAIVISMHFASYGISNIFNIYAIGPPLCWNSAFLGIFSGVSTAGSAVFPVIIGLIFMKSSNRNTAWLILIAVSSELTKAILYGFASHTVLVFVAVLLGSLSLLISSGARTIIADLVDMDEQGKNEAFVNYLIFQKKVKSKIHGKKILTKIRPRREGFCIYLLYHAT